jgi:phosphoserine aminotransferase
MAMKPDIKPARPWFASGPTAKRPGWSSQAIPHDLLGRGIRDPEVVARFAHGLKLTREVLRPPADYELVYLPGSDTGAVEAALWSMLGARPVQVLAFENFGKTWAQDVRDHLKIQPEILEAPWGGLPDLSRVDPAKDLVFPWNGTTSGVRVPDADFIAADREGLTICDATSAAFAMPLDWARLDVVTFSFQKALGGEAGIGIAVLSPRAIARLDAYEPPWPVPKVLRLTEDGRFNRALTTGSMINTFSVWTIEDWIDALEWARDAGGLDELIRRTEANAAALDVWVRVTPWIDYLAETPDIRSTTSVCLKIIDARVTALDEDSRQAFVKRMKALLEAEGAAFDVEGHRNAPAGLRVWCGCTVETADIEALGPWLDWAFATVIAEL